MLFFGPNRIEQRNLARQNRQARQSHSLYQARIASENITNMSLQNQALMASIEAMSGRRPGIAGNRPWDLSPALAPRTSLTTFSNEGGGRPYGTILPESAPESGLPESSRSSFPSLAEIQSMITSSQQEAEENFMSRVNLLQTQEQQRQEEDQLSARNAANRIQGYQRQSAIGAWESALRGR